MMKNVLAGEVFLIHEAVSLNVCRRRLSLLYVNTEFVVARHMKHHYHCARRTPTVCR